jgi:hypothetical protein
MSIKGVGRIGDGREGRLATFVKLLDCDRGSSEDDCLVALFVWVKSEVGR